ncbi:MAG: Na+/H+ antiporter NhaA [Stackebrandtia sp.]
MEKNPKATDDTWLGMWSSIWRTGPSWLHSEHTLARYVARPVASFLRVEYAGGLVLLAAAVVALVWANSPWSGGYEHLWNLEIGVRVGDFELVESLRNWVNDGLMVVFFFVVGLEIKYELVSGELKDPKTVVMPIAAAVGGMAVPAAIYYAVNAGGPGAHGWGVPMATDIAFALGIVALLGKRIPSPARIFLLTLAIVDDIGAIAVIAIFYTEDLSPGWLAVAGAMTLVVGAMRIRRFRSGYLYAPAGVALWLAVLESGIHATIAGVIMGLMMSARPLLDREQARAYAAQCRPSELTPTQLQKFRFLMKESVAPAERLEYTLHPWSSYVVLPVFALANAGIYLGGGVLADAVSSTVALGVVLGLVLGKSLGVTVFAWLAVRLGWGRLPDGTSRTMLVGLATVAGVGFTVSLFISGLAFSGDALLEEDAKVGVLGGSVVAAGLGAAILMWSTREAGKDASMRSEESAEAPAEPETRLT